MAGALYKHYTRLVGDAMGEDEAALYGVDGRSMSEEDVVRLAREAISVPANAPTNPLTNRELEVAGLLADGLTNRQIAEQLVVSERTSDAYVDHIRNKLGFRTRAQIASWVTESRLNGQR